MSGWIKLHRKMIDWEWIADPNVVALWIQILLRANYKTGKFMGREIPAGSMATSVLSLSSLSGLSKSQTRTALNKLSDSKQITIETTNKFSIISIVKWGEYQGFFCDDDKPIANESQATSQTDSNNIRKKEVKERIVDDAQAHTHAVIYTPEISDVGGQATLRQEPNHVTIGKQIAKITGWDQIPNWFGNYSRITEWLARGWNPELDIIPAVTRIMAKRQNPEPPQSLRYFEQAIADAHKTRLSPLPEGKPHGQHSNGGNRRYTAADARREVLEEYGISDEDQPDHGDGRAVVRHPGHLRIEAGAAENPHESHGRGSDRISDRADRGGFRSLAQITAQNPNAGAYPEPDRESGLGGGAVQAVDAAE